MSFNEKKKEEIPIFFTIDNDYAKHLYIALKSIIKNASKEYKYKIIVLHDGLDDDNIANILSLENDNFKIEYRLMKEGLESIKDRDGHRLRCDYFTLTIYFRILIPDMFPEYDKGIYIDSDIIVPGDISELYNIDLEENLIGAGQDISVVDIPPLVYYIEEAVGISINEYINSGVLLMNLKKLREKEFANNFLRLLDKYHFRCLAPDQDYINAMCNSKIKYLNEEWNVMPNDARDIFKKPKLIHYNLFQKPWYYDNIQYEEYYLEYVKNTPYYDEVLQIKKNYSKEEKESDKKALMNMAEVGVKIPDDKYTFKKTVKNGEKIRL